MNMFKQKMSDWQMSKQETKKLQGNLEKYIVVEMKKHMD